MPTRTFQVPDISCGHCKDAIEGRVGQVDGVAAVVVDVAGRIVTVDGDVPDDDVVGAIEDAGYEVAARH